MNDCVAGAALRSNLMVRNLNQPMQFKQSTKGQKMTLAPSCSWQIYYIIF